MQSALPQHSPELETAASPASRPKEYVKLDWESVIDKARRANGRWVLVANAVPSSVLRTIRQKRHRHLKRDDGELVCRAGETAVTADGRTVMDVYAYWQWSDETYDLASARPENMHKVTLSEQTGNLLRTTSGMRGESNSAVIRDALLSYVLHGTRYVKPGTTDFNVTVNEALWQRAQQRAAAEGLKFSRVLEHEVKRQLRQRTKH